MYKSLFSGMRNACVSKLSFTTAKCIEKVIEQYDFFSERQKTVKNVSKSNCMRYVCVLDPEDFSKVETEIILLAVANWYSSSRCPCEQKILVVHHLVAHL